LKQKKARTCNTEQQSQSRRSLYAKLLRSARVTTDEAVSMPEAVLLCLSRVCECTQWPFAHARILSQEDAWKTGNAKEVWYVPFLDAQAFRLKAMRMSHLRSGLDWRVRMVATQRPVVLTDLARDLDAKGQFAARELGLKSALGIPVLAGESATAICEFFSTTTIEHDDLWEEIFAGIGAILARAVEARRYRDRLRDTTAMLLSLQDDERRRLARELHGSTGQNLSMMIVDIDLLGREQLPSPEARAKLAECRELARRSLEEVRTFSYVLHPPFLEELGVFAALREFVSGFCERCGIDVTLDLPDSSVRFPQELETTIFRVVQESLSNVHIHSHASTAAVRITLDPGEIAIAVEDNGSGLPVLAANASRPARIGVGIGSMRERVRQCGGTLKLRSGGAGTQLQVSLPLQQMARARLATA